MVFYRQFPLISIRYSHVTWVSLRLKSQYLVCSLKLIRKSTSQFRIKLPACTTDSRTTEATTATNSSANLKFVWLNPSWCYWVLAMLHNQDYQNSNIKSHSLRFLLWKTISVCCKVVQRMHTGYSSALCLGFPSHRMWVDNGSSN